MQAPELRPLGIGQILDVGINIFVKNLWTLVRVVLVVVVPVQIISALITVSALGERRTGFFNRSSESTSTDTSTVLAGGLAVGLLSLVATKLATGACFRAIGEAYLGRKPDWKESLLFAARRVHSIIWVTFLAGLAATAALLLLIIPGIYLYVGFTVAVPVLLMEGTKGSGALSRSRQLVKGRWWGTFGIVILGGLLTALAGGIVSSIFAGLSSIHTSHTELRDFILNAVSGSLSGVLTTPLSAAFVTVLYFDLRVRKEAFDLRLLAQRMGVDPGELPPAPAVGVPPPAEPPQAGRVDITVECPKCGVRYGDWYRPDAENLTGDARTFATTATCFNCGRRVAIEDLERGPDEIWRARSRPV